MYKWLYRHFLSNMDPERAHNVALWFLEKASNSRCASRILSRKIPTNDRLNVDVAGLKFSNPLGMAAGFDKKGLVFPTLFSLGFGHVEVGTVTLSPRDGKPRPRIWRLGGSSLFNRMGLPGPGMEVVSSNVWSRRPCAGIVGISIAPTNEDFNNLHLSDARIIHTLFMGLFEDADYITVNLSCPNVNEDGLYDTKNILQTLSDDKKLIEDFYSKSIPIFVKSGPSLHYEITGVGQKPIITQDSDSLRCYADLLLEYEMSGMVLVNTFPDVIKIDGDRVHGGRSGPFLMEYGIEAVSTVYSHTNGELPIIGVGGVENTDDVLKYIKTGASLVQLYTGFINHGPKLPAKILDGVLKKLDKDQKIEDIVGVWS